MDIHVMRLERLPQARKPPSISIMPWSIDSTTKGPNREAAEENFRKDLLVPRPPSLVHPIFTPPLQSSKRGVTSYNPSPFAPTSNLKSNVLEIPSARSSVTSLDTWPSDYSKPRVTSYNPLPFDPDSDNDRESENEVSTNSKPRVTHSLNSFPFDSLVSNLKSNVLETPSARSSVTSFNALPSDFVAREVPLHSSKRRVTSYSPLPFAPNSNLKSNVLETPSARSSPTSFNIWSSDYSKPRVTHYNPLKSFPFDSLDPVSNLTSNVLENPSARPTVTSFNALPSDFVPYEVPRHSSKRGVTSYNPPPFAPTSNLKSNVLETPSARSSVTSFNALSSDFVPREVPLHSSKRRVISYNPVPYPFDSTSNLKSNVLETPSEKPTVTSFNPFVVPILPKVPSWIAAPTAFKPLFSNSVPYLKNGPGPKQLSSEPGTSSYKPWIVLNPTSEVPEKFSTKPAQTSFKSALNLIKRPTFELWASRLQYQRKKVPRERSNEAANTSYNDAIEVSDLSDISDISDISFSDEESSNEFLPELYVTFERAKSSKNKADGTGGKRQRVDFERCIEYATGSKRIKVLEEIHRDKMLTFRKSINHQQKLRSLQELEEDELTKLGSPVKHFVCREDFSLGKGSMGTCVYLGILEDGSEVAVKRMLIASCQDAAENERKILNYIEKGKSPFIVNYRHFLKDDTFLYLIVDLCEETLHQHVHSKNIEYLQEHGRRMIKEVLTGLKFLHDERILHRDLKPSNVLVDVDGHMRLADFGISRVLNEDETTILTDTKGTEGWMAAEVIENMGKKVKGRFKKKSDIQSAGMIAFFILTKGEHPFGSTLYDRMANIAKGNPVNLNKLDIDARQFVSRLISRKIHDRPTAQEAMLLPFLNGI